MLLHLFVVVCTVTLVSCRARVAGEPQYDQVLQPGYPGWKQPAFKLAPKQAQGRFLYYRKTPEVERLRSAVHELYMRPYNYVSYEVGGEKPSQYQYHHHSPTPYQPEYHQEYQYHQPENTQYQYHAPEYHTPEYHTPPIEYQNHVSPPQYPAPEYHQPEYPIQEYHHPEYPVPTYPQSYDPSYASTYPSYPTPHVEARVDHHAVAVIKSDKVEGVIHFYQLGGPTSPVRVSGNLTGLTPGPHGFHVHQFGDTTNGCKSMAGHFNPFQLRHGSPQDSYRHVGDLGNIEAGQDGVANIDIEDRQISLNGLNSILGRGLVLHAGQDDLGRGGDNGSLKTGNAGGRVACAVIAKATDSV